ncbi:MAG: hypothetical protein JXQ85_07850 [Cognatishimia sp.]|uniref:hypothetical protein n=1 Tax=Cognatishimia sp. TaxID=2211648 RepID=UPI003B8D1B38
MYKQSLQIFLRSLPFLAFVAATLAGVEAFVDVGTGPKFVVTALLAHYFTYACVTGQTWGLNSFYKQTSTAAMQWKPVFFLKYGLLFLPSAIFFILLLNNVVGSSSIFQSATEGARFIYVSCLMLASFFVFACFASIVGTALPAIIANKDHSWKCALSRGKSTFFLTFWRMTYGPILFGSVHFASLIFATPNLAHAVGTTLDSSIFIVVVGFFGKLTGFLTTLLTMSALALAFRSVENQSKDLAEI